MNKIELYKNETLLLLVKCAQHQYYAANLWLILDRYVNV